MALPATLVLLPVSLYLAYLIIPLQKFDSYSTDGDDDNSRTDAGEALYDTITESSDDSAKIGFHIAHGTPAVIKEFPFYAGLVNCGAAILTSKWVVTSAHCVQNKEHWRGSVWVGGETFASSIKVPYTQVFVHPNFNPYNKLSTNDVALLKLNESLRFSDKIQPVWLPRAQEKFGPDSTYTLVGRGVDENGELSPSLQKSTMKIHPASQCIREVPYEVLKLVLNGRKIYPEELDAACFCISRANDLPGLCPCDSGSPLLRGKVLIGLGSFTIVGPYQNICEQKISYVVNVATYVPWIERVIAENQ